MLHTKNQIELEIKTDLPEILLYTDLAQKVE